MDVWQRLEKYIPVYAIRMEEWNAGILGVKPVW